MKIAVAVGTRPELIKMAPIVHEMLKRRELKFTFIHTGQHYDFNMSDVFIRDLDLPKPDIFLGARSGSYGQQMGIIMRGTEQALRNIKPDIVLVEGDTNSSLGVALTASMMKLPIGHVEAGCRSFDMSMPEEINRVLISDLSSLHFAPTQTTVQNLIREGIRADKIFLTGHPIIDLLDKIRNRISGHKVLTQHGLASKEYYLLTIHRRESVDDKNNLRNLLEASRELTEFRPVIFPVHPHTRKNIKRFKMEGLLYRIIDVSPLDYLNFLNLINHARLILTDSGGVQQEAAILGSPCITLRKTTEWVETVDREVNFLAGTDKEKIFETVKHIELDYKEITSNFNKTGDIFGRVGASKRIIDLMIEYFNFTRLSSK